MCSRSHKLTVGPGRELFNRAAPYQCAVSVRIWMFFVNCCFFLFLFLSFLLRLFISFLILAVANFAVMLFSSLRFACFFTLPAVAVVTAAS